MKVIRRIRGKVAGPDRFPSGKIDFASAGDSEHPVSRRPGIQVYIPPPLYAPHIYDPYTLRWKRALWEVGPSQGELYRAFRKESAYRIYQRWMLEGPSREIRSLRRVE